MCTAQGQYLKNLRLIADSAVIIPSYRLETTLLLPLDLVVLILVTGLLHAHEVHVDLALIGVTLDV